MERQRSPVHARRPTSPCAPRLFPSLGLPCVTFRPPGRSSRSARSRVHKSRQKTTPRRVAKDEQRVTVPVRVTNHDPPPPGVHFHAVVRFTGVAAPDPHPLRRLPSDHTDLHLTGRRADTASSPRRPERRVPMPLVGARLSNCRSLKCSQPGRRRRARKEPIRVSDAISAVWGSAHRCTAGQQQVDGSSGGVVDCRGHVRRQERKPVRVRRGPATVTGEEPPGARNSRRRSRRTRAWTP